jgi:hypothetical protein
MREYLKTINKLDPTLDPTTYQSDNQKYLKSLDNLMRNIEQIYAEGKINDSEFGILKDKISAYRVEAGSKK